MALIAMAVHNLDGTPRANYTERTLHSLMETVDFTKHRLVIIDNGSNAETIQVYKDFVGFYHPIAARKKWNDVHFIYNGQNIGTARAINKAWKFRLPGENAIKMDNDVVIHSPGWIDEMEEAIKRMPSIGIIGLKRKDLDERPDHETHWFRSQLVMLPHQRGERWIVVEVVHHVMGTCQMYSSALLDKIGYLVQPSVYGFDDALSAVRCRKAGFINVFLPHINIDHIDEGGNEYTAWKQAKAGEDGPQYERMKQEYESGTKPIYYNGE